MRPLIVAALAVGTAGEPGRLVLVVTATALVADNLDIGRPERTEIIFKPSPRGPKARWVFKTAIDRHATVVTVSTFYRYSRIKQYMKDGRAMRIETVVKRRLRLRLRPPAAQLQ